MTFLLWIGLNYFFRRADDRDDGACQDIISSARKVDAEAKFGLAENGKPSSLFDAALHFHCHGAVFRFPFFFFARFDSNADTAPHMVFGVARDVDLVNATLRT